MHNKCSSLHIVRGGENELSTTISIDVATVVRYEDLTSMKLQPLTLVLLPRLFAVLDFVFISETATYLIQVTTAKDPWADHKPNGIFKAPQAGLQKQVPGLASSNIASFFNYCATGDKNRVTKDTVSDTKLLYLLMSTQSLADIKKPHKRWIALAGREQLSSVCPFLQDSNV